MKTWQSFLKNLLYSLLGAALFLVPLSAEAHTFKAHGIGALTGIPAYPPGKSPKRAGSSCQGCPLLKLQGLNGAMLLPQQHTPELLSFSAKLKTWDTRIITKRVVIN